jgi:hypothetical protein
MFPNTLSKDGNGPKVTKKHQYQRTCETTIKRQRPILGGVWRAWRKMRKYMLRRMKDEHTGGAACPEKPMRLFWVRNTVECLIFLPFLFSFFSPEQQSLVTYVVCLLFHPSPISVIFFCLL